MSLSLDSWRGGATVGKVYVITEEQDLTRVGHCWANGRLKVGDALLCIRHSGDCFYDYLLLEVGSNYLKAQVPTPIGAYCLGTAIPGVELTFEKAIALQKGESLNGLKQIAKLYHEICKQNSAIDCRKELAFAKTVPGTLADLTKLGLEHKVAMVTQNNCDAPIGRDQGLMFCYEDKEFFIHMRNYRQVKFF